MFQGQKLDYFQRNPIIIISRIDSQFEILIYFSVVFLETMQAKIHFGPKC